MDTLTFGTPVLLRHLTFSEARKEPINQISLDRVLEGLGFDMEQVSRCLHSMNLSCTFFNHSHHFATQFIDMCILLGCDYCDSIKGIGPKKAVELIQEHKNLETIVKKLDPKKYPVPEDWPYKEARELFRKPDVLDGSNIEVGAFALALLTLFPSESVTFQFVILAQMDRPG